MDGKQGTTSIESMDEKRRVILTYTPDQETQMKAGQYGLVRGILFD